MAKRDPADKTTDKPADKPADRTPDKPAAAEAVWTVRCRYPTFRFGDVEFASRGDHSIAHIQSKAVMDRLIASGILGPGREVELVRVADANGETLHATS